MRRILMALTIVLHVCGRLLSQDIVFSPMENGHQLNEEQIRNINQLPDGRLVIITEGMFNLFDGAGFKNIHFNSDYMASLDFQGYYRSYIENNRLWFKNQGKLVLIDLLKEQCVADPLSVLRQMGFNEAPADLFVDTGHDIWLRTVSNKLVYLDSRTKRVITFLRDVNQPADATDKLFEISKLGNLIYLFYRSGLMLCLDHSSGKELYRRNFLPAGINDHFNETLIVAPVDHYLYQIRTGFGTGQLTRLDTRTLQSKVLLQVTNYWFNNFAADKKGNCWLSSRNGLWYFKAGEDTGTFQSTLHLAGGGQVKNEISTVFCDQQDGVWAGALNKGLYYYHPDRTMFRNFDKSFFQLSDAQDLQVNCLEQTSSGELLAGTQTGLYKTRLPLDRTHPFTLFIPELECRAMCKDSSGNVWIASLQGLYKLDRHGHTEHILNYPVNHIMRCRSGELLVGTATRGLLTYNERSRSFQTLYPPGKLYHIRQIVEWKNNLVGVMGTSGKELFLIDRTNKKMILPPAGGDRSAAIFSHSNYQYACLLSDHDGLLWFGTHDGLDVWDDDKQKLYQLNTKNGLVNSSIKALIEDDDHSVWITTSKGVSHLYKHHTDTGYSFRITNYNKYDGLIEHGFTDRAAFLSPGSGLFIGGVDGMNAYRKKPAVDGVKLLDPVMIELKLFGKVVEQGEVYGNRTILPRSISSMDSLVLDHDRNFLSIGFSGLNYTNPSQTYFKYKLEGLDKDWRIERALSGVAEAYYTNLSPGTYVFNVLAATDTSGWADNPKKLTIVIRPPFWDTIYARICYIIMLALAGGVVYRYYSRRNRQLHQEQKREAVEKAKSDFMTNISHELRTPLGLIITPLRSLLPRVADGHIKEELLRINSHADILLDTVNELLDFRKLEAGSEMLHLSYCTNLRFLEDVCTGFQAAAQEKEISFTVDIADTETEIWIDRQKLIRIVINLLSNALKFTPRGGQVAITVRPDGTDDWLTIGVNDTGGGIRAEDMSGVFERFYQAKNHTDGHVNGTGIGLYMVRQYAQMHGGDVNVTSTVGKGSFFEVRLLVKERSMPSVEREIKDRKVLLIIEDNAAFRDYLTAELQGDYDVVTAGDGRPGLQLARQKHPDLIITDMMMPGMTGLQFCRCLRQDVSISHTPVIMLTARASIQAEFEGYESGADAYLVKPFDIQLLRLRIEKLLQRSIARKAIFDEAEPVKADAITANPLDQRILEQALDCVDRNLSNPCYSVVQFSGDMHMDRTGLYRKLVALTGHSPNNFIKSIRLKKATALLVERKIPIAQIAETVGFNSVSYFTKCFHEEFGKSPTQYLAEWLESKIDG